MKKLILFAAGLLLLAACSKKNDPKPTGPDYSKFAGTWSASVDSTYITSDGVTKGTALTYNNNYFWKLNADGTGQIQEDSQTTMPINFSATSTVLSIMVKAGNGALEETLNFTIVSVSSTQMVLTVSTDSSNKEVIYFTKQ